MKLATLLALVAVMGLVGVVVAADAPKEAPKDKPAHDMGIRGKIVKVEGANVVVKTWARGGEGKEVTVVTDDKTVVTIDEKDAKVADLKADLFVRITPAEGTAQKIVASTKAPERKKPADAPAAPAK
jgi:hypothetical protein